MKHTLNHLIVPAAAPLVMPRSLMGGRVRADATDMKAMFDTLNTAVAALREDGDSKFKAKADDVIVTAKFAAINETISNAQDAMQAMQAKIDANTAVSAGVIGDIPGNPEYIVNFKNHMRTGAGERQGDSIHAAMQIGSAPDGGYLAPIEWDRSITTQLIISSPIRADCEVLTVSGTGFSRLVSTGAPGSGWVGETAPRPQTSTPQFASLAFGWGEIYANPAITQTALDDAAINLESWLSGSVNDEFGRQETIAFLSGDGVNKPFGILTYVAGAANAAKHPFGAIKVITAAATNTVVADDFLNLIADLPPERSANAKFYMNRVTKTMLRKAKDTLGNYIWAPGLVPGAPDTLFSYPVSEIAGLPLPTTGNVAALFGNMKSTYLILDRVGIRLLRDPYTNKPYVMFYTTKRVGGGVQNPEYMRALKMA